jgi:hypothetical protein
LTRSWANAGAVMSTPMRMLAGKRLDIGWLPRMTPDRTATLLIL